MAAPDNHNTDVPSKTREEGELSNSDDADVFFSKPYLSFLRFFVRFFVSVLLAEFICYFVAVRSEMIELGFA